MSSQHTNFSQIIKFIKFAQLVSDQTLEMDRKTTFKDRIKGLGKHKKALAGVGVLVLLAAIGLTAFKFGGAHLGSQVGSRAKRAAHSVSHSVEVPSLLGTYQKALHSIDQKITAIRSAEAENSRLRLENTHLRLTVENLRFDCHAKDGNELTKAIEYRLDKETGSQVGRTLASIAYRIPSNLLPHQTYTLGVSYFKAREDEKAAVILTFLTGLDENDTFKSPKNFLMTGITWYRLDNFDIADRYFDRVLRAPDTPDNRPSQAQARLWKALVAQRLGKHTKSQFWLTELIDQHPHAREARWINAGSTEAERGIATEEE